MHTRRKAWGEARRVACIQACNALPAELLRNIWCEAEMGMSDAGAGGRKPLRFTERPTVRNHLLVRHSHLGIVCNQLVGRNKNDTLSLTRCRARIDEAYRDKPSALG